VAFCLITSLLIKPRFNKYGTVSGMVKWVTY
jgi:hypothetical protein